MNKVDVWFFISWNIFVSGFDIRVLWPQGFFPSHWKELVLRISDNHCNVF